MHFQVAYPFAGLLAGILLAAGASYWLYLNNPLKFPKPWMNRAIMALRFVILFFICFLLLKPMLKWATAHTDKPILVIAIDNSESMLQGQDSSSFIKKFEENLNSFKDALGANFQIETYTLGASTQKQQQVHFREKLSNISDALLQIENDNYNLNHAATVLISDGMYNQGSNPVYALEKAKPVYTLCYGDTTQTKDALISSVKHNQTVFVGNEFEILANLKAFLLSGQTLNISLSEGASVLGRASLLSAGNQFFSAQRFSVIGAKEGLHTYTLHIEQVPGEKNVRNNTAQIQVNVLKAKQKIVLLYQTPHPDIAAIKNILQSSANIECTAYNLADYQNQNFNDAALFILHQIPGQRGEGLKLVQRLQQNNTPLFFIIGKQSGLNNIGALSINGSNQQSFNEAQANLNEQFTLFTLSEESKNAIQKFAPLFAPYGNYRAPADAEVLLTQQIGYVKTANPLLFYANVKGSNHAYLCGEGFWRWQLQDQFQNHNNAITSQLLNKTIQWVAGKTDRSKFRVNTAKKFYDENEQILFEAELFNDLFEKLNQPEISLELKHKNRSFSYQFSKTDAAYKLLLGPLQPGEYSYTAKVGGQEKYGVKTGVIHVKSLQTEALQTRADHQLLRAISNESGAKSFSQNQWKELQDALLANQNLKPVIYRTEEMKELLNQKWLFFLILAMLSIEWLIRKWNGFI